MNILKTLNSKKTDFYIFDEYLKYNVNSFSENERVLSIKFLEKLISKIQLVRDYYKFGTEMYDSLDELLYLIENEVEFLNFKNNN